MASVLEMLGNLILIIVEVLRWMCNFIAHTLHNSRMPLVAVSLLLEQSKYSSSVEL